MTIRVQLLLAFVTGTVLAQDTVDLNVVHRIKAEAFKRGEVGDHVAALTDRFGPRLTASPEYDAAANWVLGKMKAWGVSDARLEPWGAFGRAWSLKRFSAHMVSPQYSPLVGFPLAWSDSTNGVVSAEPVLVPLRTRDMDLLKDDIARVKKEHTGKLKGKMVMITQPRNVTLQFNPPAKRYTDAELTAQTAVEMPDAARQFDYSRLALPEDPNLTGSFIANARPAFVEALERRQGELMHSLHDFLRKEGAMGVLTAHQKSEGGTVFGNAAGPPEAKYSLFLPTITLTPEHYNRIARLLKQKEPVMLEFEVRAEVSQTDVVANNVVAEISGGSKAKELIILGAHLDSWVGGTGATDNAAGCAVAIEAIRILKALNLKLDRTVRMVLWSGEEQIILGSKAYVKRHFGDPATMHLSPDHARASAYFNLDNGSGRIRGVYLQSNDAARPVFERWLAPFRDQGVTTISIRNVGGSDHLAFDAVGIPGFQFIQDPLEYSSRTHHSNMDVLDRVQTPDLMQASAVMAAVVYHAANRTEMMPRKPLPEPEPEWNAGPKP